MNSHQRRLMRRWLKRNLASLRGVPEGWLKKREWGLVNATLKAQRKAQSGPQVLPFV